jgi:hypothetical protein
VIAHGLGADDQQFGDLDVGVPVRDQGQDFTLAVAEFGEDLRIRRSRPGWRAARSRARCLCENTAGRQATGSDAQRLDIDCVVCRERGDPRVH